MGMDEMVFAPRVALPPRLLKEVYGDADFSRRPHAIYVFPAEKNPVTGNWSHRDVPSEMTFLGCREVTRQEAAALSLGDDTGALFCAAPLSPGFDPNGHAGWFSPTPAQDCVWAQAACAESLCRSWMEGGR